MPPTNRFGSKLGALYSASTPPVFGSIAIAPPCSESPNNDADVALQVEIDVRVERRPGLRRQILARAGFAHDAAARVHLDEAHAFAAAQRSSYCFSSPLFPTCWPGLVAAIAARLASSASVISPM